MGNFSTTDSAARLGGLLTHLGLNANELSKALTLRSPQIFYDIERGKCGISKRLANKIAEKFLDINRSWLLTGEGSMLVGELGGACRSSPDGGGADGGGVMFERFFAEMSEQRKLVARSQEEIAEQRKLVAKSQEQLTKSQEQIDRLLGLLEKVRP